MQVNNFSSTLIGQTTTASRMGVTSMKKFRMMAALSILLLSLGINVAQAQPRIPLAHFNGLSTTKWTGGNYGAETTVELSNPSLSNTGDFDWGRDLSLITSDNAVWAGLGFEKNNSLAVWNHCYGVGLWFFYSYNGENTYCFSISQTDPTINHPWFLEVSDNPTGGMRWVTGSSYGTTPCLDTCVFNTSTPAWYQIRLGEYINNVFTGHNVWGVAWTQNQWATGDYKFHYQTVPSSCGTGSGCPQAANPPQMYWQTYPANDSSGGVLYSCDYDTGTTCSHGS